MNSQARIALRAMDDESELEGHAIVGREINLKWSDGRRYDAVVVRYYHRDDEYKLVYPEDEGVEVASLQGREWHLLEKKISTPDRPVLIGSIIEFVYPKDQLKYQAMVYQHSENGEQLKVCYLDEHSTDAIGGRGWDFVTDSPCALPYVPMKNSVGNGTGTHAILPSDNELVKSGAAMARRGSLRPRQERGETNSSVGVVRRGRVSKKPWYK